MDAHELVELTPAPAPAVGAPVTSSGSPLHGRLLPVAGARRRECVAARQLDVALQTGAGDVTAGHAFLGSVAAALDAISCPSRTDPPPGRGLPAGRPPDRPGRPAPRRRFMTARTAHLDPEGLPS